MRSALILAALFGLTFFTTQPAAAQQGDPCATGRALYGCDSSTFGRSAGRATNSPNYGGAQLPRYGSYGYPYDSGTLYLFAGRGSAYYEDLTPQKGYYSPFGGESEKPSTDPFNCLSKGETPPANMPPPRYRKPSSHHRWCARLGKDGWYDARWMPIGKGYD